MRFAAKLTNEQQMRQLAEWFTGFCSLAPEFDRVVQERDQAQALARDLARERDAALNAYEEALTRVNKLVVALGPMPVSDSYDRLVREAQIANDWLRKQDKTLEGAK